jgi:transposase
MSSAHEQVVAGIDVHKSMLMVVVARPEQDEKDYLCRRFGASKLELEELRTWLTELGVLQVAMESTAKYWKPVWLALEGHFQLWLAQARSTAAPRGRKTDSRDARRIVKRLRADDLTLSYVPEQEQRMWRDLLQTRLTYQEQITRLRNRIEGFLEEGQIKISGLLSDLFGFSGWRILEALAEGESDAGKLAALAHEKVRATPEQLRQALSGKMEPLHRLLLKQALVQIRLLDQQIKELEHTIAEQLRQHQDTVSRLCAVVGIGAVGAFEYIARLGPQAKTFPTAAQAASWAGVCPGREESAGVSSNNQCPKGNRYLKRQLVQNAWAAVRAKGSQFERLYKRLVVRLGPQKAIIAVAHRLLIVIWKILHEGASYDRSKDQIKPEALKVRARKHLRSLRALGLKVSIENGEAVGLA